MYYYDRIEIPNKSSYYDYQHYQGLEINKHYLISDFADMVYYVKVSYKTNNYVLLEFINPNNPKETYKKFFNAYDRFYRCEEIQPWYTRNEKIDELLKD